MAHARNGYIFTSAVLLLNLTSLSCSSIPLSYTTRKFRRFGYL